jgi:nucleoside-diphosphate-sugar epimerase
MQPRPRGGRPVTPDLTLHSAAVIGATGPTGKHLARELVQRGISVRVISRSAENLERAFAGLDAQRVAADAVDAEAVRRAIDGCDVAFDCIGLPAEHMDLHPMTAKAISDAASALGCRCVQVSSFWSYLPARSQPINEGSPREGGNFYIRMRRQAEDIILAGGGAVLHLPDFFGPEVHASSLQSFLEEAAEGDRANWIGSADTDRDYVYVPDAMRVAADLADHSGAYGKRWVLGGSGALSARRVAEIAGDHLGKKIAIRSAPPWMLRIISLFSADLRAFMPMVPYYVQSVSYDECHLAELIGPIEHTVYAAAIPTTLDWILS